MIIRKAIGLVSLTPLVLAQCYLPNGTDRHAVANAGTGKWTPCAGDSTSGHTMCCNTNTGDQCRDGLCWNEGSKLLWRESCTDPTWQSIGCLKLCISNNQTLQNSKQPMSDRDVVVTHCADGSYCCGNGDPARKCCEAGDGVKIVNGQVVNPKTTKPTTSASSTATSSTSASSDSSSDTASDQDDAPSNQAAVIGGAVGGILGAVLLGAGSVFGFLAYKRRQKRKMTPPALKYLESHGYLPPSEDSSVKELASDQQRFELDGGSVPGTASSR